MERERPRRPVWLLATIAETYRRATLAQQSVSSEPSCSGFGLGGGVPGGVHVNGGGVCGGVLSGVCGWGNGGVVGCGNRCACGAWRPNKNAHQSRGKKLMRDAAAQKCNPWMIPNQKPSVGLPLESTRARFTRSIRWGAGWEGGAQGDPRPGRIRLECKCCCKARPVGATTRRAPPHPPKKRNTGLANQARDPMSIKRGADFDTADDACARHPVAPG